MAGYQMQGGTAMQGMTMTPAQLAAAQMAAQQGQLPKANSAQLQQQLVMPAASAPGGKLAHALIATCLCVVWLGLHRH